MNPNVDLGSFRRGGPAAVIAAPGTRPASLVAPPRRFLTRYLLPSLLLMGFGGVGLYAVRGSVQPTVPVRVVMPVIAASTTSSADPTEPAVTGVAVAADSTDKDESIFQEVVQHSHSPAITYSMPIKGEALLQAPGWVEPEPYKVVVPSLQMGHVKALHVLEGQRVTSGALIAEMVDEDAQLAVQQAEALLALKQARYEAARADWENPVNLTESMRNLEAEAKRLTAEKEKAQARLELATKEAAAGQSLTKSGFEAGLDNFRRQAEERTSRSEIEEIEARQRQNDAMLTAARERLRLRIDDRMAVATAEAEVRESNAKLAEARLMLDRTQIRAHSDGVIMEVHVSPGEMLMGEMEQGMKVVTMYDPDKIQIRVDVPISEAAKVRPGLPAEIRVDALPEKVYQGVLTRIVPLADVQRNTLPVKVHVFSPDEVLQPEMLAKVQFFSPGRGSAKSSGSQVSGKPDVQAPTLAADLLSTSVLSSPQRSTVLVPEAVLQDVQGDKAQVWLAGPDNRARLREVQLGSRQNELRVVKEGVQVADRLIASNFDQLRPDIQIRIQKEKK